MPFFLFLASLYQTDFKTDESINSLMNLMNHTFCKVDSGTQTNSLSHIHSDLMNDTNHRDIQNLEKTK